MIQTHFIQLDDDLKLHYVEAGQGPQTILLIPGWTMTTEVFERQLSFFDSSTDYHFITLDPRAHGLSSNTADGHFYPQHGRDLNAFIEALELDQIILGGWSFGTLATLAYVSQFGSDRLSGFIMLDGPPKAATHDNETDWATYRYDDSDGFNQFFTNGRLEGSITSLREFSSWLFESPEAEKIDWVMKLAAQMPNSAAALLNASATYLDYSNDLIDLSAKLPLCYIVRKSRLQVVANWSLVHTPLARVEGFGEHIMFWERADEFNVLLLEFCEQVIDQNPPVSG